MEILDKITENAANLHAAELVRSQTFFVYMKPAG